MVFGPGIPEETGCCVGFKLMIDASRRQELKLCCTSSSGSLQSKPRMFSMNLCRSPCSAAVPLVVHVDE